VNRRRIIRSILLLFGLICATALRIWWLGRLERSLARLHTDRLDIVFIHSNGDDIEIQRNTGAVAALVQLALEKWKSRKTN